MRDGELFHGEEFATELSEPFWSALHDGRLSLQHCLACDRFQHYPRLFCIHCGSDDWRWDDASASGTVFAVTTLYRSVQPSLADDVPYDLAMIRLQEGPLLFALVGGDAPLSAGTGVVVDFVSTAVRGLLTVVPTEVHTERNV